ncbi:RloB family protein [Nitrospirillum sp. BR 11163]|uniref:RloB family protein n=1 Tax=Nitrospirillum sp. BR 11163 TaxID=3104323 RepID=UPI002AFE5985|nr:RloB family protein [Nitrospirillum sp. BR 11163]MEA1673472.1 RloB family protein [Nitrospirillum sp. BR 11163]
MKNRGHILSRNPKQQKELSRSLPSREPLGRILVVCEGLKTEPNYFNALARQYRARNVIIKGSGGVSGTDPCSVLQFALECNKDDGPYENIFCVFDKEGTLEREKNLEAACAKIDGISRKKRGTLKVTAVKSIPCFEYWVLLHFEFTTKPFVAAGGKSCCESLISKIKGYMPEYSKGRYDLMPRIVGNVEIAIQRSENALSLLNGQNSDNPSTYVHLVAKKIISMASK